MNKSTALVIDDEPAIRELLEMTLERMDIDVRAVGSLAQAKQSLQSGSFDICLTDMKLPDGNGLDLVEYIQAHCPALPVAVITAHGSMEAAIRAMKSGAFDFVSKPLDLGVLRNLVHTALKLRGQPRERRSRQVLLGESEAMREIRAKIAKLGRSQAPVFVSGESGTGKELVARLIHAMSPRADQPFVPVNCGAIPEELMESEFFGHKKGSFTGAVADKQGLFQAANGGSLFLDEVADLPLSLQVKLLRAIQEKSVRPVGEAKEIQVDTRIISATHKNLAKLVEEGAFRQDLFYRINVIGVHVPSLRERRGDIPILVDHVLDKLAAINHEPRAQLAPEALDALMGYRFPGNVRELENILERAVALCEDWRIMVGDLDLPESLSSRPAPGGEDAPSPPLPEEGVSLENYMDEIEKQAIIRALEKTRWNRTAAAKLLGITFRALRYKLKKLDLE
ncbi:sigma-54-dependent transcriptional regulator [Methylomagnum ishizawai]|uniref:sigma-54-dependent transcriptional regulator n=1 Tax=Methylomagnum ishizawai TaxID=1760988 RepID=UPI001C341AAC|nr:sigma-54 dependent transcriptional regulator [Methylomagnum ishizawai]BBL73495.1 type 4 fimbriae expression regulatory protein PilR [Methylomagnum ishizawai]